MSQPALGTGGERLHQGSDARPDRRPLAVETDDPAAHPRAGDRGHRRPDDQAVALEHREHEVTAGRQSESRPDRPDHAFVELVPFAPPLLTTLEVERLQVREPMHDLRRFHDREEPKALFVVTARLAPDLLPELAIALVEPGGNPRVDPRVGGRVVRPVRGDPLGSSKPTPKGGRPRRVLGQPEDARQINQLRANSEVIRHRLGYLTPTVRAHDRHRAVHHVGCGREESQPPPRHWFGDEGKDADQLRAVGRDPDAQLRLRAHHVTGPGRHNGPLRRVAANARTARASQPSTNFSSRSTSVTNSMSTRALSIGRLLHGLRHRETAFFPSEYSGTNSETITRRPHRVSQ